MARFTATVKTSAPDMLDGLQVGQWIDYDGARGRWIGRSAFGVWIAWGRSATDSKRFRDMVAAFKACTKPKPYPRRTPPAPVAPVAVPPSFEAGMIYSPKRCPGLEFFVMSGNAETVDVWKVLSDRTQQRVGEMDRYAFARLLGR